MTKCHPKRLFRDSQPKTHQIARFVRAYREPVRRLLPRNLPVCINGDYLLWPNCKRGFPSYTSFRNLLRFWSELPKRDKLFFLLFFFCFYDLPASEFSMLRRSLPIAVRQSLWTIHAVRFIYWWQAVGNYGCERWTNEMRTSLENLFAL